MSDEQFGKELAKLMRSIARDEAQKVYKERQNLVVGKVVSGGSGATISVYINDSTTAVSVKNPNGLTLTTGQLVVIEYPNGRDDGEKYIDRIKT